MPTSPKLFEPNTKALFQKWAERDFRADTTHLHWQARLFYRSLLQAAFFVSTRPDLPDDNDELRRILGGVPDDVWVEHQDEVRKMFQREEVSFGDGEPNGPTTTNVCTKLCFIPGCVSGS
jgi:hypothetical protein